MSDLQGTAGEPHAGVAVKERVLTTRGAEKIDRAGFIASLQGNAVLLQNIGFSGARICFFFRIHKRKAKGPGEGTGCQVLRPGGI